MPFNVTHLLEIDCIPPAQIGSGSNDFCVSGIAEAGAAEGFDGGAER
ncbi:MAG: hypothetical protein KDJ54_04270 [Candidatus Competibacteraceae bacterium]|nr:hypothetical protein [Candidatus Competibacteraceae bacterium]